MWCAAAGAGQGEADYCLGSAKRVLSQSRHRVVLVCATRREREFSTPSVLFITELMFPSDLSSLLTLITPH